MSILRPEETAKVTQKALAGMADARYQGWQTPDDQGWQTPDTKDGRRQMTRAAKRNNNQTRYNYDSMVDIT